MAPTARGTQGTSAASANLMNQLDASKPAPTKSVEEAKGADCPKLSGHAVGAGCGQCQTGHGGARHPES